MKYKIVCMGALMLFFKLFMGAKGSDESKY